MGSIGRRSALVLIVSILVPLLCVTQAEEVTDGGQWTYHTSFEISASLLQLSLQHDDAEYTTAQELLGTRQIPGERDIPILFIGDRTEEERAWIMIIGAHHGDEPDSAETVLAFAQYILNDTYAGIFPAELRNGINIALLPVVNPYGLDHQSRYDENGEDPNRDYPFEPEGSVLHSDGIPLTTAGAHAVHSLAKMYPFSIALSFHTGSEGIFTPWGAENVGNLTPDRNMFRDLGGVLSRASGKRLNHGPANDFGTLGYLKGAFDDHLYGSTFYSQHLASGEFILPWSTATATIELVSAKGQDEARLGDLDGVLDMGGANDGTVSAGVRMSLAACQLLVPLVAGEVRKEGDACQVNLTFTGASTISMSDLELGSGDDHIADLGLALDKHPFLPEYHITGSHKLPDPNLEYNAELCLSFDMDWNGFAPDGDPEIAPQSVLSLSRWDPTMELHFVIGGEPLQPEPEGALNVLEITPFYQEAGRNAWITLDIPPSLGMPLNMSIYAGVNWNVEITYIAGTDISQNISRYEFLTPLLEGEATVEVLLDTEKGRFNANSTMWLYPYVRITNVIRTAGEQDMFRLYVGVDGALAPVTVFYGLSRDPTIDWWDDGWIIPPTGLIAPGYGPMTIDIDLSGIGGTVHFRVCSFPGSEETSQQMDLRTEILATSPRVTVDGEMLTIGPSVVYMRWNGLNEVTPSTYRTTYQVEVHHVQDNTTEFHELTWLSIDHMSETDRIELLSQAKDVGMSADDVTGGWIGYRGAPTVEGEYLLRTHIYGESMGNLLDPVTFEIGPKESIPFIIGGEEKDAEDREFPWALFILILMLILGVFIISYIRKGAHIPKEDDEGTTGERNGRRVARPLEKTFPAHNRSFGRAPPPWEGGDFK
ncbi:MAG: succinylglutamate desuccinylase/aspartoacylase family protein [Candidatus Thermoplasmatota archaeon]|nr:succinylglutamate desuccinylase/aspartoacylase family protein [Candidatus Thermoplasmatota archaeon]